jgi:hypothetical protein
MMLASPDLLAPGRALDFQVAERVLGYQWFGVQALDKPESLEGTGLRIAARWLANPRYSLTLSYVAGGQWVNLSTHPRSADLLERIPSSPSPFVPALSDDSLAHQVVPRELEARGFWWGVHSPPYRGGTWLATIGQQHVAHPFIPEPKEAQVPVPSLSYVVRARGESEPHALCLAALLLAETPAFGSGA